MTDNKQAIGALTLRIFLRTTHNFASFQIILLNAVAADNLAASHNSFKITQFEK